MANTPSQDQPTSTSAQHKGRTIPDNDSPQTDDRGTQPYRKESQGRANLGNQISGEDPGSKPVEIGDPVPEDQRTVRAGGETGEDEDLPADDGNIESRGEPH